MKVYKICRDFRGAYVYDASESGAIISERHLKVDPGLDRWDREATVLEWLREFGFEVNEESKIHTVIGVYADGSHVINGVPTKNLRDNIAYNKSARPGRAIIVDGRCIYKGSVSGNVIIKVNLDRCNVKLTKDTQPYK